MIRAMVLSMFLVSAWTASAMADRIFYRSETWRETSSSVQRLSLLGVLRAWERMAETADTGALSLRQREALHLHDCLTRGSHSTDELLERVTAFASAHPDRLYYSLSDFIAEGLKGLCSES